MSAILRRTHRATLLFVVALLGLSLASPLVTLAQASFTPGETAVISADGGSVNVRTDADPNAESLGQIPDGTEVYIVDGPFTGSDGSTWYLAGVWDLTGYINASMLGSVSSSSDTASAQTGSSSTTSSIPWKQPIDYGVVVDNSNAPLPNDGLACRTDASSTASTIARMWLGQSVEVVGQSVWAEGIEFLPINCEGVGGFVKADYVALQSQQVAATEEVVVTEEVVTEEAVDPNAPVAGDLIVTVLDQNGATVPGACFTLYLGGEWIADSCDSNDAVPNNGNSGFFGIPSGTYTLVSTSFEANNQEVAIGAGNTAYATVYTTVNAPAATEEVVTEEVVTEEVATDETATEVVATEEATTEEVVTEEAAADDVVTAEVVTDEAATDDTETQDVTEGTPEATVDTTGTPVAEEPTDEVATETPVTEEVTDEATPTDETATEDVTEEATEAPGSTLGEPIGDATVTGTNGGSLACRVAPDASSAVITTLAEGATVFVYAEQVNGYLAIGCGDQLGYADVNYLFAGGAGDEIPSSASSIVVVGTGGLSLNCRAGAGTSYGVVATVAQGTVLTSRGASTNGWAPVVCNGKNGFVSISFVEVTSQKPADNNGSNNGGTGGQTGTVTVTGTGSSLRCRTSGSSSGAIITSLPDGTVLTTRGAASNGWLPVVCGGQNGFVSSDYVTGGGSNPTTPPPTATATPGDGSGTTGAYVKVTGTGGSSLNCRSAGSLSGMVITAIPFGSTVATRGAASNGWLPVTCGGKSGYVSASYVTATTDPGNSGGNGGNQNPDNGGGSGTTGSAVVDAGGDNLRCRSAASSSASVITSVPHGTTVTTRGASSNGWTPVVCGGQNGFMASEFLSASGGGSGTTPTPPPTQTPPPSSGGGMVNGDHGKVNTRANMRYQATTSSNVVVVVEMGEVLLITGNATNGFYPVDYDGLKGFMSSDLLGKTSEALSERGGSGNEPDPTPPPTSGGGGSATGSAIVNYAMRYVGYPYVWATHGPSSFDCSGFTSWVIQNVVGQSIGYGLWTQVSAGPSISRSALQPGDLVFFQNTYKAGLSHVGVYIGNNQFVHAENENTGVRVSDLNSSYYGSRWYGAVRVG